MRHESGNTNLEPSQMKHIDDKVKQQQADPKTAEGVKCDE